MNLDKRKQGFVAVGGGTRIFPGYSPDFRLIAALGYNFGLADTNPGSPGKRWHADKNCSDRDHDGICNDVDPCPDDPGPKENDGCPKLPDRDGDGIPDIIDKCPDEPEDFDGIQDADGCPEDDADHDGIPDAQDACPMEPGDPDPDPSKNGCPKYIRRIKGSSEIQILQQIQFETGSAVIKKDSYKILNEVVRLLKVNPEITLLSIEGHTDNRGSDELNDKLSKARAKLRRLPGVARHRGEAARQLRLRAEAADRHQRHRRGPAEEPPHRVPHPQSGGWDAGRRPRRDADEGRAGRRPYDAVAVSLIARCGPGSRSRGSSGSRSPSSGASAIAASPTLAPARC